MTLRTALFGAVDTLAQIGEKLTPGPKADHIEAFLEDQVFALDDEYRGLNATERLGRAQPLRWRRDTVQTLLEQHRVQAFSDEEFEQKLRAIAHGEPVGSEAASWPNASDQAARMLEQWERLKAEQPT